MARLSALAALFGIGLLMAVIVPTVGSAETTTETTTVQTTSTEQLTTTVQQTTTTPAITVVTTATLPLTGTTTGTETSGTPTWVWVLLAVLGAAVIGLLVYVLTRGGSGAIPDSERRLRLQGAIDSWTTQGWALLSESTDTAVLQRGSERMTVTVDPTGHVSTRAMTPPPPEQPPDRWPE